VVIPQVQWIGLLMADAEATARAQRLAFMLFTSCTTNDQAIRFYEKRGWEKRSARPGRDT
jgi:ribosomal protein S18 acetylase RimI-like enzyme